MTVWVVVADYGLNGAGVLAVFQHEPTGEEVAVLQVTNPPGWNYPPQRVTGFGGLDVQVMEITP